MTRDLADMRQDYRRGELLEVDLAATWHEQVARWLAEATASELVREPNAVVLSTATPDGRPSSRTVLLKGLDERGLVVYTNYGSRKATEAEANPQVALLLAWVDLERQVHVEGTVERVSREETEAYFATRPRGSQLGAWASHQSSVTTREQLEQQLADVTARFEGQDVPAPDFWGGLRVVPTSVELWQGRTSRLHDRLRYARQASGEWSVDRLSP